MEKFSTIQKLKENKGLRGFILRFVIFMTLFALITYTFPYYKEFLGQEYGKGNSGFFKFIPFFIIVIFLYSKKEKIEKLGAYRNNTLQTATFGALSFACFSVPMAYLIINLNLHPISAHYLLFGTGCFFLYLSIFNTQFALKYMQSETLIISLFLISYLLIPLVFTNLWEYFFYPIKHGVNIVLNIANANYIVENYTQGFRIKLESFDAIVGPACSGIFSISAFSFLYATSLVFLKNDREINKKKAISIYAIGVTLLYLLNIVRVIVLMYIGAYISRELAIDLFHEYMSAIFLMSIFLIYLYKLIPKVFIPNNANSIDAN